MLDTNLAIRFFIDQRIINPETIISFFPIVRDREDVAVYKCDTSEIIFLSRSDHIQLRDYTDKQDFEYWGGGSRDEALQRTYFNDQRMYEIVSPYIANKIWMDVGCGLGGVLEKGRGLAKHCLAVEPQYGAYKALCDSGLDAYQNIESVADESVDVITLFHVFEHLLDPAKMVQSLYSKLKPGGVVIIEVPHARDFLLSFLNVEEFKKFTLWSEHLILHTRESLRAIFQFFGFNVLGVKGVQRYPLSNHLYWLKHGEPGGHEKWAVLNQKGLVDSYEEVLQSLDKTDTIVLFAQKEG